VFSDALDREAAWLAEDSGGGLPVLKRPVGPFEIIQPRWPRVASTRKTSIYVLRAPGMSGRIQRTAGQRSMLTTRFVLHLKWPLTNGAGSAEAEQLLFEQAIDHVLTRVQGPFGDKTHGGRFQSVAESPDYIDVDYSDPERGIADGGIFTATITYSADDPDFNN